MITKAGKRILIMAVCIIILGVSALLTDSLTTVERTRFSGQDTGMAGNEFWISFLAVVGVVILLIGGSLVWNRSLKNQVIRRTEELKNELAERKKAELRLRKSEERYRVLFESAGEGILIADLESRNFIYANPAICKMLGYSSEELTRMGVNDIHPGDELEHVISEFKAQARGEKVLAENIPCVRKDGTIVITDINTTKAMIDGKECNIGLFRDVTERKRAEKSLRESERRFRELFSNMSSGVAIYEARANGHDFLFKDFNPAAERIEKIQRADIIDKSILDIFPGVKEFGLFEVFQRVWKSGKPEYHPISQYKDQRISGWRENYVCKLPSGEIITIYDDITERKQAQEALRASESRYQELFDSVMEGIGLVDENETILFCNPAFAAIFEENSVQDMIGKSLLDYVSENGKSLILSETEKRKEGQCTRYELEILTAKGNSKIILSSISPRFDDKRNYLGAFGAVMDITEMRRLQEFTVRAQRLEMAGRIAGQVAHDFNNLLGPLMAYPELLKSDLPSDHSAVRFVEEIEKAAEQMAEINQQLLTLGRRGHYKMRPVNLNSIVIQAIDQIHPAPETLTITKDLCQNLMNTNGGEGQLFRIMSNLINNARDAMQDTGHLKIRTENFYVEGVYGKWERIPQGEYVKLTVSDTGSGIPDDILSKIFEPFFTTKTADKRRGSGLGLSVVHAVVEDHNGYIDCESTPGQGTSFYLYFPITRGSVDAPIQKHIVSGNESILVVDDDEIQRDITRSLLEKIGYTVTTAARGQEAIDYIKTNSFDLLILDMIMPDSLDGTEIYKRALEIDPSQKAVMISGYAENKKVAEALEMGAGEFIKKPLTLLSIARVVRKELDKKTEKVAVSPSPC